MLAIATSELLQNVRNRSVLITGLIVPVAVCAFFIYARDVFEQVGGLGYIAAILVFTISAFGLYATVVTTLATRRQTLFLKRLRSTAAGDGAILTGLVLPTTALAFLQLAVILTVFALIGSAPENILLLAIAVLATLVMMLALALATAGLTNSPEHAQVTTLPITLGVIAVASWVGITGTESLTLLKRLLPGGAATELISESWNGSLALGDSLFLLAPTLAWVVVGVVLATALFRWEPRR